MKTLFTLFLLALLATTAPAWAQHRSAKSRAAKLAATRAAQEKAERARRAEAAAKLAAAMPVSSGPDADELLRIEESWAQATIRNDAETITHLLADEYVSVNSLGLVTGKSDVLAAIANDEAKCDINKPFEYIVRVYGNAGLVVHNTSFRGRMNGNITSGEYRTTHMFIKRNGKWLVVANQTTFVVPERMTLVSKNAPKGDSHERKRKRNKDDVAGQ
ncbi:nuclear transport factor 2 family protein [Hymenobacter ruricola]|uniref:Nuclear transport factor 2 family protein n=1 Tax=Hymenobacter ruricola TaxID=2791023 RepID=A0ABS0I4C3_9BACT|nr:nuclear transport factor 2 family protein [Hymenobacter ruricola]MBF9221399.1 nuclear transport factor 2 family protein [Hymenobacter ruricola]